MTNEAGDYIALDEQSKSDTSDTYRGIKQAASYERTIPAPSVKTHTITAPSIHGEQQVQDESEFPEIFHEYAENYIKSHDDVKKTPPEPIKVTDFKSFMSRERSKVVSEIIQQFKVSSNDVK